MNFKKSFFLCFFITSSFYLYSSNTITITNSSKDSVYIQIKFSSRNFDTILFDKVLLKNEIKSISIPNTDSIIGTIDINFYKEGETYLPTILKKAYCHRSDLKIDFKDFHYDSIKVTNELKEIHPKSFEMLDGVCLLNEISFVLQKDIPKYGKDVPNPYKIMDLLTKFYLNSEVVDLYKLKRIYDYCSFGGNEYISKEDLEGQIKRFDTSKWTYLHEYKKLKGYLNYLKKPKKDKVFDYIFLNEKKQEEKLLSNSKKLKVYVFWATPCGKITCYPYFEKLIAWKNKLKKVDFITISSETTHNEWLIGIARCYLKSWKNYRNPNESMAAMVIDYQIPYVYQSFLVLGKNNEELLKTSDYEVLDAFLKKLNAN
jgi:hypothetical protein